MTAGGKLLLILGSILWLINFMDYLGKGIVLFPNTLNLCWLRRMCGNTTRLCRFFTGFCSFACLNFWHNLNYSVLCREKHMYSKVQTDDLLVTGFEGQEKVRAADH